MKKILAGFLFMIAIALTQNLSAQDFPEDSPSPQSSAYRTALGVRLSSSAAMQNNSISIKQFITDKTAIEGLFSFGDPLSLGALLEFHKPLAASGLTYFYGVGGYIGFVKTVNTTTQKT